MAERFPKLVGAHVLLMRGNTIFLIHRVSNNEQLWSIPAGHVDDQETVVNALIREAMEEVGIILEPEHLSFAHVMNRRRDNGKEVIEFFHIANEWSGEPKNCEPDKCDEVGWFPIHDLPKTMAPYVRQAIDAVRRGKHFSEFGW